MRSRAQTIAIILSKYKRKMGKRARSFAVTSGREHREPGFHDDGTITFLHGTSVAAAEAIRAHGFKALDARATANMVEERYGLPKDSVYNHEHYQFEKGFRKDDPHVYLTGDPTVAQNYTEPESLTDALGTAYVIMHPEWGKSDVRTMGRENFIRSEVKKLTKPVIISVTVPWRTVAQNRHPKMDKKYTETYQAFRDAFDNKLPTTTMIPATALADAHIAAYNPKAK